MGSKSDKERGISNEFAIVDALRRGRMGTLDIAKMLKVSQSMAHKYVKRLMDTRRIHLADNIPSPNGRPKPMYAVGPGENNVYLPKTVRKPKQPDRKSARIAQVMKLLEKPHTAQELGELMLMSTSGARRYVSELRAAKMVYVHSYKHPGKRGDHAPRYKLGEKKDAQRPEPESRIARWRKEISTPERHNKVKAKKRVSYRATKPMEPASWLGALGL